MTAKRKRGRAAVEQRLRRLAEHPICAKCAERGLVVPTAVIDHIVPFEFGGTDDDENVQGLCLLCHAIKTALEGAGHGGGATHPHWLKPSGIPLEVVCGPPCAGKTTYVEQRARAEDAVVDLDAIHRRIDPSYRHWSGPLDPERLNRALRIRNAMLGSLATQTTGRAFFVVAAPSLAEREWWRARLGERCSWLLLDPGAEECRARAINRGTPRAIEGVDRWYEQARLTWRPAKAKLAKVGSDAAGYPLGG